MKTIIFDLDGVICSTDEYHYLAWKQLADSLGIEFDREKNNRLRGVSRMDSLEIVLENYEGILSQEEKNALAAQKNETYVTLLHRMDESELSEEVKNTLDLLRERGYLLTIGSSSKNTPVILKQLGLDNYFDAVSDGNNISHSKPDPEVFIKAAQMVKAEPEECVVVEDSEAGVIAVRRGGMKVACVGDAAKRHLGDWNLNHIGELSDCL